MATSAIPSCIAPFPLFICHVNTIELSPPPSLPLFYLLTLWLRRRGRGRSRVVNIYQILGVELKVGLDDDGRNWTPDAVTAVMRSTGVLECLVSMWWINVLYEWIEATLAAGVHGRNAISFGPHPQSPPPNTTLFAAIRGFYAREHSSLPFKHSHTFKWRRGEWGEWLPAVTDHALTVRFWYRHHTRANNNFTFGVLLYCAFILAVPDWRLIDYWVDCECNRVVWALPLPSAVLECLYIKIKKKCV